MSSPPPAAIQDPTEPWRILRWRSRHQAYREVLATGVEITMLRIPAGSFLMGAPEGEEGSTAAERPVHQVKLEEFLMGQTPITQAQWRVVAGWPMVELELKADPSHFKGDQRPVETVSWHEAAEFCRRLRQHTRKPFALPSEAQWEYACRAGTRTPFHFGATISPELANVDASAEGYGDGPTGEPPGETTEVGRYPANPWGLHDMHGNVWEWCSDHWHQNYQGAAPDGHPWIDENPEKEAYRLLRGGSWGNNPWGCRSAYRSNNHPGLRNNLIGIRVCCLPQDSASLPLNPSAPKMPEG